MNRTSHGSLDSLASSSGQEEARLFAALLPDYNILSFNKNDPVLDAFMTLATIFICDMEITPMIPFMLSQCNVESRYVCDQN